MVRLPSDTSLTRLTAHGVSAQLPTTIRLRWARLTTQTKCRRLTAQEGKGVNYALVGTVRRRRLPPGPSKSPQRQPTQTIKMKTKWR